MAVAQFFLYTAAVDKVRRAEFQIFWINHHMFIVFLGFTIPHKPDWVLWFAIPALMYMYEKIQRYRRGSRPVILKEVRYIEPVLELRFEPTGMKFQDGQYVFLCCPRLGRMEWHPFTISSPEGDLFETEGDKKFMSLHIKIIPGGWTERLKQYLERMNPQKSYPFVRGVRV
jgi:predicted ferric reductase